MGKRLFMAAAMLLALGAFGLSAASAGARTSCNGPKGPGTIPGDVSAGAGCELVSGTTVNGNVTVNPGGSLTIRTQVTITRNVHMNEPTGFLVEQEDVIGGNLRINGLGGDPVVGPETTIKGNLEITNGKAAFFFRDVIVGGNVKLQGNTGSVSGFGHVGFNHNTVGGNIQVSNNSLTGSVNYIEVNENTVDGNIQVLNNSLTGSAFGGVFVNANPKIGGNLEVNNNIVGAPEEIVLYSNVVTNNLRCYNNESPPTDLGAENTAKHKHGQCEHL